jgi:hypothetical protein
LRFDDEAVLVLLGELSGGADDLIDKSYKFIAQSALNRCSPPPSANASSQNLVNATAIEIDDFETPPLMIKAFANGRQVTELIESEARSRVIVALLREGDGQPVSHLVDRHAAGDEP